MYLDRLETKHIQGLMKNWEKNHEKTIEIVLPDETVVVIDNDAFGITNMIHQYCNEETKAKFSSFNGSEQSMIELYIEAKAYLQQIGVDEVEGWIDSFDRVDIQELEAMEYDVLHDNY